MPLTTEQKSEVIDKYKRSDGDTGSPEVQVALLSERITQLGDHCKVNPKDAHSRGGLLKMVGTRRNLLNYIKSKDFDRYRNLIENLGLRR